MLLPRLALPAITALAVTLTACGGSSHPAEAVRVPKPITAPAKGVQGFTINHAFEESYWYSRYNMMSLNMTSGNGSTFMPPAGAMPALVGMASDGLSTATPPGNPALVDRVFDLGNPAFSNPFNGAAKDFQNYRWTPVAPAQQAKTSAAAFGWTLTKILEWDRQFEVDNHFGFPGPGDAIPGAQERFAGLALFAEAMMMTQKYMAQPASFDNSDVAGQYAVIMAFADFTDVLSTPALPLSAGNRYRDAAPMLAQAAGMDVPALMDGLQTASRMMVAQVPVATSIPDAAVAVQALNWYLTVAPDAASASAARTKLVANAAVLQGQTGKSASELAYQIRGTVDAWRVTGDRKYLDTAAKAYFSLEDSYDSRNGVFTNQTTYTPSDVAGIVGGLNSAMLFLSAQNRDIDPDRVKALFTGFWEGTVNLGGLQIASPDPLPPWVSPYERQSSDLFHRYPTQPRPQSAGGANGYAPVYAKSVTWNAAAGSWTVDRSAFDTAGAMHLATEGLWLHSDEVNGFPVVN